VLVIEAAFASGSLITARWAADQGRTVLAVPGRVDHPMARGCHRLLREGALLAEDPEDVLRELGLVGPASSATDPQTNAEPGTFPEWLTHLRGETLTADELAERSGVPVSELLARLVELELAGRVARGPGGLWRLA
jgi:DNA processing protein